MEKLVYDYPIDVLDFPNYKGKMYHIVILPVDLNVKLIIECGYL
jgi:hypothetical protein